MVRFENKRALIMLQQVADSQFRKTVIHAHSRRGASRITASSRSSQKAICRNTIACDRRLRQARTMTLKNKYWKARTDHQDGRERSWITSTDSLQNVTFSTKSICRSFLIYWNTLNLVWTAGNKSKMSLSLSRGRRLKHFSMRHSKSHILRSTLRFGRKRKRSRI